MKRTIAVSLFLWAALGAFGQDVTLVNTLATRPVFSLQTGPGTETRTLAPGQRVLLAPGLFSGLGQKKLSLVAGATYYLARFGSLPGLYQLAANQTLVLNQSDRAVAVTLRGESDTSGVLAVGALALGGRDAEGRLTLEWDDGSGNLQTAALEGGRVYRLILDSPQGTGTTVSLTPWG